MKRDDLIKAQGARLTAARIAAGFRSGRAASAELGFPESTYGAHEGGRRTIGQDDAEKYAKAFRARGAKVDAQKILFGSEREQEAFALVDLDPEVITAPDNTASSLFVRASYGGVVEAGTFREVGEFDDPDRDPDYVPRDDRFPRAAYFIFDVAGDSMNAANPPMGPGSRVIAVKFDNFRNRLTLQSGDVVVIERTRDDGALRERSIKELELDDQETPVLPAFDEPPSQTHHRAERFRCRRCHARRGARHCDRRHDPSAPPLN